MEEPVQEIVVSYSELQSLDEEDVAACVPKQSALDACSRHLNESGVKTVEVLGLWLKKLLRAYINDAATSKECATIWKYLYEWFQGMKGDMCKDKTACSDYGILLADALDFANWAKAELLKSGQSLVHTAAFFLLAIVHWFLEFQKAREHEVDNPDEQMSSAIDLHLAVLFLLKEITAGAVKVHARINPLIRQLSEICEYLSLTIKHLHVQVETSETMTYMCTHYCRYIDLGQRESPDWLKDTLLHLCDTVLSHIETIYSEDALRIPVEKVEGFLKISRKYLQMLSTIFNTGLRHIDDLVLESLLELLMGAENKPTHDLGKDIPLLLSAYVRPHIMQIYEQIYQLEDFQKNLLAGIRDQNEQDCFELCIDYITVATIDDAEIRPHTCQTIQEIFEYLFKDECQFIQAARYDRIIEAYGLLLHVADCGPLCNYFIAALFQQNVLTSQASADVLVTCFRLEAANQSWSGSAAVQAKTYWLNCNNSFARWSQNPSQLQVQRMLKFFLHLRPSSSLPLFSLRNYRYLCCASSSGEVKAQWLMDRLRNLWEATLTQAEVYYEMIALMELLGLQQLEPSKLDWLPQMLCTANALLGSDKCVLFVDAYFKLVLLSNRSTQQLILQKLSNSLVRGKSWHFQKWIATCKGKGIDDARLRSLQGSSKELLTLLDAVLHTRPLNYAAGAAANIYAELSYAPCQKHLCVARSVPSLKRKRDEHDIIGELYEKSLLLGRTDCQPLDAAAAEQLKMVIENLSRVLRH